MNGFSFSTKDLSQTIKQAEATAKQAQKSAEQAQQIINSAQQTPPVSRPPSPIVSAQETSSSQFFKDYAIPIVAVSAVAVLAIYFMRKS